MTFKHLKYTKHVGWIILCRFLSLKLIRNKKLAIYLLFWETWGWVGDLCVNCPFKTAESALNLTETREGNSGQPRPHVSCRSLVRLPESPLSLVNIRDCQQAATLYQCYGGAVPRASVTLLLERGVPALRETVGDKELREQNTIQTRNSSQHLGNNVRLAHTGLFLSEEPGWSSRALQAEVNSDLFLLACCVFKPFRHVGTGTWNTVQHDFPLSSNKWHEGKKAGKWWRKGERDWFLPLLSFPSLPTWHLAQEMRSNTCFQM